MKGGMYKLEKKWKYISKSSREIAFLESHWDIIWFVKPYSKNAIKQMSFMK